MAPALPDLTLYLVLGPADTGGQDPVAVARAAEAGGAGLVQLRDKTAPTRRLVDLARALKAALTVPVLVNDRVDVALAAGTDGVHLGQDDMHPADARRLLGPAAILGLSVGDAEEAKTADPRLVDYVGIGPAFATGTKADAGAALGPAGVAALRRRVRLPAVAIGGITAGNAGRLSGTGIAGVAVVSALAGAADPEAAARGLRTAFAEHSEGTEQPPDRGA